ncbi:major capsid protein [Methylobacterium nodulans]|uniref:Putative phage related protein n=1 Tax=Methylobacterium nodulans (strain LMG 21967 / CNCM I-2342 / ORS 2060) TaxID=460265 RepID=B8IRP9_METNO|nr:major capsid protein [Methylobacterium nodulans]ACL60599.1 putative phage related protein [Methylobacterium nodulans ORS 2060]
MANVLNLFDNAPFSAVALTASVNVVPNAYGRLNELDLFSDEYVPTTAVMLNIDRGVLNLLPMGSRGGPASLGRPGTQRLEAFVIPHIPHDDAVLALDVQNRLAWVPRGDTAGELAAGQDLIESKLITMRRKHAITLEYLRVGAIKGAILDYDGTVYMDLFARFGVTPKSVDFTFGTASADLGSKCREISGYIEDNLMGDTMSGVMALCSPAFFDRLVTHASVKEAYKYFVATQNPLRNDLRKGFIFQNITFEEYRGSATKLNEDKSTSVQRFIPDGDARFFPLGTTDTFTNYWAPPDFWAQTNTAPNPADRVFVAPLEPMEFGKGMKIHTESNPLPLCKRPSVLVRGFSSN